MKLKSLTLLLLVATMSQVMHRFVRRPYVTQASHAPRPQFHRNPRKPVMHRLPEHMLAPQVISKKKNTIWVRDDCHQKLHPHVQQVLEKWFKP